MIGLEFGKKSAMIEEIDWSEFIESILITRERRSTSQ